jgi:hypothetical protein
MNELKRVGVGVVISGTILAFAWMEKGITMQTKVIAPNRVHKFMDHKYIYYSTSLTYFGHDLRYRVEMYRMKTLVRI